MTVSRCAGYEDYVGQRVTMNIPKVFPQKKKLSKKSADSILFVIGAEDDCDFSFENDGYMSGRYIFVYFFKIIFHLLLFVCFARYNYILDMLKSK